MGWTPTMVRGETYGDFMAAFRGWQMGQGTDTRRKTMSRTDLEALMRRYPDKGN